jgi:hypothetical protein
MVRESTRKSRAKSRFRQSRNRADSKAFPHRCYRRKLHMRSTMGRGILLWLLGVPIPIIILLALIWH